MGGGVRYLTQLTQVGNIDMSAPCCGYLLCLKAWIRMTIDRTAFDTTRIDTLKKADSPLFPTRILGLWVLNLEEVGRKKWVSRSYIVIIPAVCIIKH